VSVHLNKAKSASDYPKRPNLAERLTGYIDQPAPDNPAESARRDNNIRRDRTGFWWLTGFSCFASKQKTPCRHGAC